MTNTEELQRLDDKYSEKVKEMDKNYVRLGTELSIDGRLLRLAISIEQLISDYNRLYNDKPVHTVCIQITDDSVNVNLFDYVKE